MLDDEVYDIMEQLVEESKSLYEIKNHYKEDSNKCTDCLDIWKKLENQKEKNIEELEKILREHLK